MEKRVENDGDLMELLTQLLVRHETTHEYVMDQVKEATPLECFEMIDDDYAEMENPVMVEATRKIINDPKTMKFLKDKKPDHLKALMRTVDLMRASGENI